jgi:hypothetical protein
VAGARVTWEEDFDTFEVEGHGNFGWAGENTLAAPLDVIGPASARSLQEAWERSNHRRGADGSTIAITLDPPERFSAYSEFADVDLWVSSSEFQVLISRRTPPAVFDNEALDGLLQPWLERHGASLRRSSAEKPAYGEPRLYLEIDAPTRFTVDRAFSLGTEVLAIVESCSSGNGRLDPAGTRSLLAAGHEEVLLGQVEADWLDAKGSPYRLADDTGKFELAKDVAAMANLAHGGILVIGFATIAKGGDETLEAVRPFPSQMMSVQQVRDVVREKTYPGVADLSVELHPRGKDKALGTIYVPPQPPELRPMLVRGAEIDGKVKRNFITLPSRVGASTTYADVANLHALVVAGRAALRGSE